MKNFVLELKNREHVGTSQARRLRREGLIPAVVYANGQETVSASLVDRDFRKIGSVASPSQLFTLKSDDKRIGGKLALVKEVQRSYVRDQLLHVDLQTVREDEEIKLRVSIKFVGESPGVKNDGGLLAVASHDIGISCLPRQIPEFITVDVSALKVNDSIHAGAVTLPDGVALTDAKDMSIVSVVIPRAFEEPKAEDATAAAAAPAEGAAAAAEGAEGEAKTAEAKGAEKDAKGK